MKKLIIIIGLIFVFLIIFGLAKDQIIKSAVSTVASRVVGAPVQIDQFSLSLFKQSIRIKGFRMLNPEGFPRGVLVDIPEISVDYDLLAFLKGKIHLKEVILRLEEVGLFRNQDGKLNVDALKVAQKKDEKDKEASGPKKPDEMMPMRIDLIHLDIGKVVLHDYSSDPDRPVIHVYDLGIKERTYKDITSAQQLAALILSESMKGAGIRGAGTYGAATILGVGFLPAGVAGVLIGKDSSTAEFNKDFESVYAVSLDTVGQMGRVMREDKGSGVIRGKVSGSDVTVRIAENAEGKMSVTVSARQLVIPKPEIAGGVIHQISEKLK